MSGGALLALPIRAQVIYGTDFLLCSSVVIAHLRVCSRNAPDIATGLAASCRNT